MLNLNNNLYSNNVYKRYLYIYIDSILSLLFYHYY